ncbi:hypothetical protein DSM112329_04788 [Paraconexibacter sp. AEG42_29]|uniref:Uncharacterized protein n=1 Tax=Paraconexibacter sp. AEG42_29 TaxID=2997339 RepID=A0AAU7B207_9ACTN
MMGIDLDQRPATYWPADRAPWDGAPTDAQRAEMKELGKQHPAFMGGAYLPAGPAGSVEIARLDARTTTADVMSLRAERAGDRITFALTDEYEMTWDLPVASAPGPLSLREVLELLEGAQLRDEPDYRGVTVAWRQRNFMEGDGREDALELVDFLTISSAFYPAIGAEDRRRALAWAESIR